MIKEQCTNRINDMLHVRNDKKDRITTDSLKRLRPQTAGFEPALPQGIRFRV